MNPSDVVFDNSVINRDKFGSFVRQKRESLGISVRDFASMLNYSPAHISDIERGNRKAPLSIEVQMKMIDILQVQDDELEYFQDLVGCTHENWPEINEELKKSKMMRQAIRAARDAGLSDEEFAEAFLQMIEDEKERQEMSDTFKKCFNSQHTKSVEPAQRQW